MQDGVGPIRKNGTPWIRVYRFFYADAKNALANFEFANLFAVTLENFELDNLFGVTCSWLVYAFCSSCLANAWSAVWLMPAVSRALANWVSARVWALVMARCRKLVRHLWMRIGIRALRERAA